MSMIDRMVTQVLTACYSLRDDEGQGLAEYGLILALVAVVVVGAVTTLGKNIGSTLTSVAGSI
jgi:pilus assembly protein Flp/PilA